MTRHSLFSQKCWSFTLTHHEEYKRKINQILLVDKNNPNFRVSADNSDESVSLKDHTQTNVYAWKSNWHLHHSFPILEELCEEIKPYLTQIIKEEKIKHTSTIETMNCWVNKYQKNDFACPHTHENTQWSAVYMMKIPSDSSSLFRIHNPLGTTYNSELLENFAILDINTKEGVVVITSGALKHEVTPNKSEEERITVAMNFRTHDTFSPKVNV